MKAIKLFSLIIIALFVHLFILATQTAIAQSSAPLPQLEQTQSYALGNIGNLQKGVKWPDPLFADNGNSKAEALLRNSVDVYWHMCLMDAALVDTFPRIALPEDRNWQYLTIQQSYTQKDLEGIWYTENRYFFIDDTGELTNIEPISMEVIHDFSGSFTIDNSNVTGTIYLDHTPSGGIRNDHDINYSGFFVSSDEIDMEWVVPEAGTGSESWKRIAYTGSTDKARIDTGNVLVLAQAFMKSRRPADNLTLYYLNGNTPIVDAEIEGTCGGNAQLNGTIDLLSGDFVGTLQYNNYCDAEKSGGFSVNGYANFTGRTDLASKTPLYFLYDFVKLSFVLNDVSFSFTGRRGMNFTVFPQSSLFSYVKKDNCSGVSYWVKDYFIRHSDGPGYDEIVSMIGRYYDPVYGYVEPSVEDTIRINDTDEWASSGKMILTGAGGVQGGYTKIRINYLSATEYLVEADTDGDGAYDDFNSGILLFAKLPRLRCFKGLPWLILLLD